MPCKVIDLQTRQECKQVKPKMVPTEAYLEACANSEHWAEKYLALMEEKKAWIDERYRLKGEIENLNFGLSVALDPNRTSSEVKWAEPIWEKNRQWPTPELTSVG